MKFIEIDDWNCCGATAYLSVNELSAYALIARNLAIAEKLQNDIAVPCSACFVNLNKVNKLMQQDADLKAKINDALSSGNLQYNATLKVRHLLDCFVNDVSEELMCTSFKNELKGLKVAPYTGCQTVRPDCNFDSPELPITLDNLLKLTGAEIVPYPLKSRCCGGVLVTTDEDIGLELVKNLLKCAIDNRADCIVTLCPLCQLNLDAYQSTINKKFGTKINIPVLYFTQLLGIAMGISYSLLGLDKVIVSAKRILERYTS
jgi:heterodisulfide reductase subunit B